MLNTILRKGVTEKMSTIKTKLATSLATGTILLYAVAGLVHADVSCTISGNGSSSDNTCSSATANTTSVTQNNVANVDNNVHVTSNTGDNTANNNTGGSTSINTGSASTDVSLKTQANANVANVPSTGSQDQNLNISGNGSRSTNTVDVNSTNKTTVNQNNTATIDNHVGVKSETGDNTASNNTGGAVSITTGDSNVSSGVHTNTAVNLNVATVGGNGGNGGTVHATISGNGSSSNNNIDVATLNSVKLNQKNNADINNHVYVKSNTGDNEANDNTNGDVSIDTGNANTSVTIDNLANFNSADLSNMGDQDFHLDISGNGAFSDNNINLNMTDKTKVKQNNNLDVNNNVKVKNETGDNVANDNTGGDTSIDTGGANTDVWVSTSGNANIFGGGLSLGALHDLFHHHHFSFLFDMSDLMGMFLGL